MFAAFPGEEQLVHRGGRIGPHQMEGARRCGRGAGAFRSFGTTAPVPGGIGLCAIAAGAIRQGEFLDQTLTDRELAVNGPLPQISQQSLSLMIIRCSHL